MEIERRKKETEAVRERSKGMKKEKTWKAKMRTRIENEKPE